MKELGFWAANVRAGGSETRPRFETEETTDQSCILCPRAREGRIGFAHRPLALLSACMTERWRGSALCLGVSRSTVGPPACRRRDRVGYLLSPARNERLSLSRQDLVLCACRYRSRQSVNSSPHLFVALCVCVRRGGDIVTYSVLLVCELGYLFPVTFSRRQ